MKAAPAKLCGPSGDEITRDEVERGNRAFCADCQCTGPVGVVFASCSTASVIRRQVAAPSRSPSVSRLPARAALSLGALSPKRRHQERCPPDVDFRYHRTETVSARFGKFNQCRRDAGEGALGEMLPMLTSVVDTDFHRRRLDNRGAAGLTRIVTAPKRRRPRPDAAGRSARSGCRAFSPCRRGWRRCRSRGTRRRLSAALRASGRCA